MLLAVEAGERQPAALVKRVTHINARWTTVMHGVYERYKSVLSRFIYWKTRKNVYLFIYLFVICARISKCNKASLTKAGEIIMGSYVCESVI